MIYRSGKVKGGECSMRGKRGAVVGSRSLERGMRHCPASLNKGAGKQEVQGLVSRGSGASRQGFEYQ